MHELFFNDGNNFKLYLGDCLEVLRSFEENTFDLVFADPPYFLSDGGFTCHSGKRVPVNKGKWDKSKGIEKDCEFFEKWLLECKRVLKDTGTIWVSGTYHSIFLSGFVLQKLGFHILNDICWFKPNAPPNISCRYFTSSHETLIWARKSKDSKHYFNYQLMKNTSWLGDYFKREKTQMRSVWCITSPLKKEKQYGKHPTQKPLELLKRIILASTEEEDIILDPFCGSSTTGIAACELHRKFVGIDTSKRYLELSIKRFDSVIPRRSEATTRDLITE